MDLEQQKKMVLPYLQVRGVCMWTSHTSISERGSAMHASERARRGKRAGGSCPPGAAGCCARTYRCASMRSSLSTLPSQTFFHPYKKTNTQRAEEVQAVEPKVAYYCRLWAVDQVQCVHVCMRWAHPHPRAITLRGHFGAKPSQHTVHTPTHTLHKPPSPPNGRRRPSRSPNATRRSPACWAPSCRSWRGTSPRSPP